MEARAKASVTIQRCDDPVLWNQIGQEANSDHPQYIAGNVLWPLFESPLNKGTDLSILAWENGRPVGRLQRRLKQILEISVIPTYRRRGVGTALIQFALQDAKKHGLDQVIVIMADEEDAPLLQFFDRLGFERKPVFSMLANLKDPVPVETQQRTEGLLKQGFKSRILDSRTPSDFSLAAQIQSKYFPGYPGFMSETEMVRTVLERQHIAMVLEKGSEWAGFIIGGIGVSLKNARFIRKDGFGLLGSIATSENFRKMGIASAIMCEFIKVLKERGLSYMFYGGCGPEGDPSRNVAKSVGARQEIRHFNFIKML